MNLNQLLIEKNTYFRKACEEVFEHSQSNPYSVSIAPIKLGDALGYNKQTISRIITELADEGYVKTSLGMGTLFITQSGIDYLREINAELTYILSIEDNKTTHQYNNTSNIMKQSEKLDLILRELYKYKYDGKQHSIESICEILQIPLSSHIEVVTLALRLQGDGLINGSITHQVSKVAITTYGVEYCEENSYSYEGHPLITNNYNFSINNSPNSVIVNQSSNISVTLNIQEVNDLVEKIRTTIGVDKSIDHRVSSEILECLNEIQNSLKNNQKPKFAIKSLIELGGGISSIGSWATSLGQIVGLIPYI